MPRRRRGCPWRTLSGACVAGGPRRKPNPNPDPDPYLDPNPYPDPSPTLTRWAATLRRVAAAPEDAAEAHMAAAHLESDEHRAAQQESPTP
eukprot:scaffold60078_cov33-Phaeocystis_antarctica.AAC.1